VKLIIIHDRSVYLRSLHDALQNFDVLYDEPLRRHTSFKIGGPADALVLPGSRDDLHRLLDILKKENIRFMIMGNGSNLLFSDSGYRGIVIKINRNMSDICISENKVGAQAGALLSYTASEAMKAGLTGLEFASGIPGTVGGAVFMNAGAYDGEIKNVFLCAEVMSDNGDITEINTEGMKFSYRHSIIQEGGIVLSSVFCLQAGEYQKIKAKTDGFTESRRSKQPLEMPSAGSVFKRPPGYFTGQLIMDCGLRGYSIGGAQVSEKHCGFIVNKGGATCDDVRRLIEFIQNAVYSKFNVSLVPEIRIIA